MLKSCLSYLVSPDCVGISYESKSRELEGGHNNCPSFDSTFHSKHIFVRVVHAGGKVDHYPNAVLAAKLLENLPGKWLARPQVFKHPHQSILCPQEYLLPGHKYYVIPLSTIHRLKRKHNRAMPGNGINQLRSEDAGSDVSAVEATDHDQSQECIEEDYSSFCSARDFYANKGKRSTPPRGSNNGNGSCGASRRARILRPLANPKPKPSSGYSWEPGLPSIQELSP